MTGLDHLVYAVRDLDPAIVDLERRLGVRPIAGGRHEGRGTRNALLALGPRAYLEILAPDPAQSVPPSELWLGAGGASGLPRITAWAAAAGDLEARVAAARSHGVPLGDVRNGSRKRADGVVLAWRLTDPAPLVADGLVPFLIDWGTSPHPAESAPRGVTLVALRAEHPESERVGAMLVAVGAGLDVVHGDRAAIIATLDTPRGRVELR